MIIRIKDRVHLSISSTRAYFITTEWLWSIDEYVKKNIMSKSPSLTSSNSSILTYLEIQLIFLTCWLGLFDSMRNKHHLLTDIWLLYHLAVLYPCPHSLWTFPVHEEATWTHTTPFHHCFLKKKKNLIVCHPKWFVK